jgi:hypothetical protein
MLKASLRQKENDTAWKSGFTVRIENTGNSNYTGEYGRLPLTGNFLKRQLTAREIYHVKVLIQHIKWSNIPCR